MVSTDLQRMQLPRSLWGIAALSTAAIGLLSIWNPVAAALLVAGVMLGAMALHDLSALVSATLLLHLVGERQGFSYASLSLVGVNLFPNDLLTLALLIAVLARGLRDGRSIERPRGAIHWSLWAFLAYGGLSMLRGITIHGWAAVLSFRVQFFYALLFVLVLDVMRSERSRVRLAGVVVVAGAVVALQGLWNVATGTPVGGTTSTDTLRYLSGLQALTLFFALAILAGGVWPKRRPVWSLVCGALYLIGILLSQARSVWIGAIFGVLTVAIAGSDLRRHGARLLTGAGVLVGVILLALPRLSSLPVVGDIYTRLTSFSDLDQDATSIWRLVVWGSALLELKASPVLGLGLGKPFVYFDAVRGEWDKESQLHNSYLELAYYTGAIGVGLLILFQVLVLRHTLDAARRHAATPHGARLRALAAAQVCLYAVAFTNVIGASMTSATFGWILAALSVLEANTADAGGHGSLPASEHPLRGVPNRD